MIQNQNYEIRQIYKDTYSILEKTFGMQTGLYVASGETDEIPKK